EEPRVERRDHVVAHGMKQLPALADQPLRLRTHGGITWSGPLAPCKSNSLRGLERCTALHHRGERRVRLDPRAPYFRRERIGQSFRERPDQRVANGVVVARDYAIARVPLAERFDGWEQLVQSRETTHRDRDHLHQLLALLRHIRLAKHSAQRRI